MRFASLADHSPVGGAVTVRAISAEGSGSGVIPSLPEMSEMSTFNSEGVPMGTATLPKPRASRGAKKMVPATEVAARVAAEAAPEAAPFPTVAEVATEVAVVAEIAEITADAPETDAVIIGRLKEWAAIAKKGGEAAKNDLLALLAGKPASYITEVITPEIGPLCLGKWCLGQEFRAVVVKTVRDKNRVGGQLTGEATADLLGISTGSVSTDERLGEEKPATSTKIADDHIDAALTNLKKGTKMISGAPTESQARLLEAMQREVARVLSLAKGTGRS